MAEPKVWYKKWWVWVIAFFILISLASSGEDDKETGAVSSFEKGFKEGLSSSEAKDIEASTPSMAIPKKSSTEASQEKAKAKQPKKETPPKIQTFSTNIVCSLPRRIAPNTPFANLGGGAWGKWSNTGSKSYYGCRDGKDLVLSKDDNTDINVEYNAISNTNIVHYVAAEYTAMQYTGLTSVEKQLRQQFADFSDKLSSNFYGVKLSKEFRKRLLDKSTYSLSGKANEYSEQVGGGFVTLSTNENQNLMVLLDIHFFSSEADYKSINALDSKNLFPI